MIAFFLTMPISRMMPMIAMMPRSLPDDHQRQQRADAGRRQRREDRDRMDVALVEHAEHDVHRDDRGEDQQQRVGRATPGTRAPRPGSWSRCSRGMPSSRSAPRDRLHRLAERRARREVERDRRRRELAEVVDDQRRRLLDRVAIDDSGTWSLAPTAPVVRRGAAPRADCPRVCRRRRAPVAGT